MAHDAERVLAIDAGGTKVAVASFSLLPAARDPIVRRRRDLPASATARDVLHLIGELAAEVFADADSGGRMAHRSVGVACPGVITAGRASHAPNIAGWEGLQVDTAVAAALGMPQVYVAQDGKLAALAEARWGELQGVNPGLYVNLGTGLAAAVVVDGNVVAGAHGASGEIGYNVVDAADRVAAAAGVAPLEALAGGRSIEQRSTRLLSRDTVAAEVFAIRGDHAGLSQLVDDTLDLIGMHLVNAAILIDPQRIVLGGGLLKAGDVVIRVLRSWLDAAVPFPPELRLSAFPDDAPLRGAAILALDSEASIAARATVTRGIDHSAGLNWSASDV